MSAAIFCARDRILRARCRDEDHHERIPDTEIIAFISGVPAPERPWTRSRPAAGGNTIRREDLRDRAAARARPRRALIDEDREKTAARAMGAGKGMPRIVYRPIALGKKDSTPAALLCMTRRPGNDDGGDGSAR